jgi:hypothetical protein
VLLAGQESLLGRKVFASKHSLLLDPGQRPSQIQELIFGFEQDRQCAVFADWDPILPTQVSECLAVVGSPILDRLFLFHSSLLDTDVLLCHGNEASKCVCSRTTGSLHLSESEPALQEPAPAQRAVRESCPLHQLRIDHRREC